jgi:hypothetical protein
MISTHKIGTVMRRSCVVAVAILLAIDMWAGEPWRQKSYKVWNQNDVRTILNESPWAKRIEVQGGQTKHAGMESSEDGGTSEGAAGADSGEGGGRGEDNERGRITFAIRWVSSRTIRQAWVRGEVLQKRVPETDTDKFLPPPSDDAQLLIVGRDMSLFEKLDETTLRAKSFLLRTKSKQIISPDAVEIVRLPDGKRIKGILFHFPKKLVVSPSAPPIDDNDLKFVSRAGTTEIKANFDLQKMVDNEGTDL